MLFLASFGNIFFWAVYAVARAKVSFSGCVTSVPLTGILAELRVQFIITLAYLKMGVGGSVTNLNTMGCI